MAVTKFIANKLAQGGHLALSARRVVHYTKKEGVKLTNFHVALGVDDEFGQRITQFNNETTNTIFQEISSTENTIQINIKKVPLKAGRYTFVLYSTINGEKADYIQDAGTFNVEAGDFFNTGKLPPDGQGSFYIGHSFKLK